jgi:hypothetical protein
MIDFHQRKRALADRDVRLVLGHGSEDNQRNPVFAYFGPEVGKWMHCEQLIDVFER